MSAGKRYAWTSGAIAPSRVGPSRMPGQDFAHHLRLAQSAECGTGKPGREDDGRDREHQPAERLLAGALLRRRLADPGLRQLAGEGGCDVLSANRPPERPLGVLAGHGQVDLGRATRPRT